MILSWLKCARCQKLYEVLDEDDWAYWCRECVQAATELLGHKPFVMFKPADVPEGFYKSEQSKPPHD